MKHEVQTNAIVRQSFLEGKRVFIPKVTGNRPEDLILIELESAAQIDSFPKSRWGIPEPPMELHSEHDVVTEGIIDMIIVPGVAFDKNCNRIGHGKGYYGRYW